MSNISQINPYIKLKQSTEADSRNFGPLVSGQETQVSTVGQTVITLTTLVCNLNNKSSVMVYIDGQLLTEGTGNDYTWINNINGSSNQISLAAAIPAGLNIQVYKLGASANIMPNADSIQASLLSLIPAGAIMEWSGVSDPTIGWLVCDGRAVSRTTYATLFSTIGTTFGSGDGSTTFNIPDKRGMFSRGFMGITTVNGSGTAASNNATFTSHGLNRTGFKVRLQSGTLSGLATSTTYYAIVVDSNTLAFATTYANALAGVKIAISGANSAVITQWEDPDAASRLQAAVGGNATGIGTRQDGGIESHTHNVQGNGGDNSGAVSVRLTSLSVASTISGAATATGGNETRPTNIAMNYIIKY